MELPTNVGAYRVLSLVDEGGMGQVMRARHRSEVIAERQGGDVAVKVMHAQLASRPSFRERFEREAGVGLRLSHPGIVTVHDLVVDGDTLALVMELVDGLSVQKMYAGRKVPPEQVLFIVQAVAEALAHAHEAGVVHRDLKPANVMIDTEGKVKVLDFGIAKEVDSAGTRTGMGMGTVAYMAPEQYRDAKRVDRRADVYALAMITYELLAGRLPWEEPCSEFELLRAKAEGSLPTVLDHVPAVGRPLAEVLEMGLAADVDDRFATTLAFASALRSAGSQLLGPQPIVPPPSSLQSTATLHPEDFDEGEPEPVPEEPVAKPLAKRKPPTSRRRRKLPVRRKTDGLAVASLVVSAVSLVSCLFPLSLVGSALGVASAMRLQRSGEGGLGLAVTGIVLGLFGAMSGFMFFLLVLTS